MQTPRIAALFVVLATSSLAQQPLTLAVGAQKSLTIPGMQRVALGDDAIADVKTLGHGELLVIGLAAGHTTLLVWKTGTPAPVRFDLTVTGPGLAPSAAAPTAPQDITPPPSFSPSLQVGQRTTRTALNLQRVAIGDPDIADLRVAGTALTLEGRHPGTTTVLLWFTDGHREQWVVTVVK